MKERVVVILEHWVKNHFYDFKLSYDEEITKVEQVSSFFMNYCYYYYLKLSSSTGTKK